MNEAPSQKTIQARSAPHHNCLLPSVFNTTWKLFLVALAVADFLNQHRMCVHIKSLCVPIGNVVCSHKKYVCAHWAHHIVCSHKEPLYFSEMNIRFSLNYFLFLSRSESRFSCGKKTIALDILLFRAVTGLAGFVAAYIYNIYPSYFIFVMFIVIHDCGGQFSLESMLTFIDFVPTNIWANFFLLIFGHLIIDDYLQEGLHTMSYNSYIIAAISHCYFIQGCARICRICGSIQAVHIIYMFLLFVIK